MNLNTVPIADIVIPTKSRDEMPPLVRALQYLFVTPELNEQALSLMEKSFCAGKKKTGRRGMDLWHILVLALVRHATNTNWDRLHMMANYDLLVRQIMGVHLTGFMAKGVGFEYQTILDNVAQLDDAVLMEINDLVVAAGHKLLKKSDDEPLRLKTDSYAVETNVHFPTDLNLLWDSMRKCLDVIEHLKAIVELSGWRKSAHMRKTLKSQFRNTSYSVFKGKNDTQKKESVRTYLARARTLLDRCNLLMNNPPVAVIKEKRVIALMAALKHYCGYVGLFCDQINRRLLKNEVIPASEKVYSIFEPHTEWITKGKLNKRVELGHLLLITTDQFQFIVDYWIMEGEKDAAQVGPLSERLKTRLGNEAIASHSFDKGFYSKLNLETLTESGIKEVVLPKKGKPNAQERERESQPAFKKLRNAHSAVESNINSLEHHGLNRCMDKGLKGYRRCVGLSVLAYNLHILGNALGERDRQQAERKRKRDLRKAAA